MKNQNRGFATLPILVIIAALVLGGGAYYYTRALRTSPAEVIPRVTALPQIEKGSTMNTTAETQSTMQKVETPNLKAKVTNLDAYVSGWSSSNNLPGSYSNNGGTWYSMRPVTTNENRIYCMDIPIIGADVATFVISTFGEYAKDKNHVYRCSDIVQSADPVSFNSLDYVYAKDNSHVFYSGKIINDADAATFIVVPSPIPATASARSSFGKDKSHVYDTGTEIPNADAPSFKVLSPNIPVDKNSIYYSGKVFGPIALMTDNTQYVHMLPDACKDVYPAPYPALFSADESTIGYVNMSASCVIDKKSGTAQQYGYGWESNAALSNDGSKFYYEILLKESMGISTNEISKICPECGKYSIDRATSKVERVQ